MVFLKIVHWWISILLVTFTFTKGYNKMNATQKQEVQTFIANYAAALNAASTELISDYYASGGLFMPDGYPTFNNGEQFKRNIISFFRKKSILIDYVITDISIDGTIALVNALAATRSTDLTTKIETTKTTRDFFVLKLEGKEWKILRYLFNNF